MAKPDKAMPNTTYVIVEKGDTLSGIAAKYGGGKTYQQLATINKISNPNLIYVGQKIYVTSSGSSPSSSTPPANKAKVTLGLHSLMDNTLVAQWTWGKESQTEEYKIAWEYYSGGVLFKEARSKTVDPNYYGESRQDTYTIPANAEQVLFYVLPVSKKHKGSNGKDTTYFTASWSDVQKFNVSSAPPAAPSGLSVEMIDGYKLKLEIDNIDLSSTNPPVGIEFKIIDADTLGVFDTEKVTITKKADTNFGRVSYMCPVALGRSYQVSYRAYNKNSIYSDPVVFTDTYKTVPIVPDGITNIKAVEKTEVQLDWSAVSTADSYEIQYTTEKRYFDTTSGVTSVPVEKDKTTALITGLEPGDEYFFRLRAINDAGESGWTEIVSIIIGEKPIAPTTWSSTTTAVVGELVKLYWVHNSKDGSSQTYADVELTINGQLLEPSFLIQNSSDEELKDKTSVCTIDTQNGTICWTKDGVETTQSLHTDFKEGSKIQWRVRTKGIHEEFGEWSVQRTIDIYAQPTLQLDIIDKPNGNQVETLTTFPFFVYCLAGPKTQNPIGYHLTITANESYTAVDNVGNERIISKGESVYSKYFDTTDVLLVEFSANNIDLENNISYTVTCVVSMNTGLTTESTREFTVTWEDKLFTPNAEISFDPDKIITHIKPYCNEIVIKYYKVNYASSKYVVTDEEVGYIYGEPVGLKTKKYKYTTTGEQVYIGTTADGDEIYFCMKEEAFAIEDVMLAVYRREFDGSFTEIMTGIDGAKNTVVTDPHPSLDYARYRIVAISKSTGAVSYYDVPGYPINEHAIIIQWDEKWSTFDVTENTELSQPPWTGSLLRLPYNVDVADSNAPDVTQVSYVGRKRPVTYYGTQLGETSSWNTEIPKDDKETLYALRRLAIWMGDVYVREPSGTGYWANITVSYSHKHCEATIPVTLNITRVEGGM